LKCLVAATALQLSTVSAHLNISRQIASRKSSSGKPAVKVLMRRNSPVVLKYNKRKLKSR
jgi:hypothetical protein